MNQKFTPSLIGLLLMSFMSPIHAHINTSHDMGLVDGLLHLVTEPSHIVLLMPAIAALLFIIVKLVLRKQEKDF